VRGLSWLQLFVHANRVINKISCNKQGGYLKMNNDILFLAFLFGYALGALTSFYILGKKDDEDS